MIHQWMFSMKTLPVPHYKCSAAEWNVLNHSASTMQMVLLTERGQITQTHWRLIVCGYMEIPPCIALWWVWIPLKFDCSCNLATVFTCSRPFLPSGATDENCNLKLYHAAHEICPTRVQVSFLKRHFVFLIFQPSDSPWGSVSANAFLSPEIL